MIYDKEHKFPQLLNQIQIQSKSIIPMQSSLSLPDKKLQYIECPKEGFHYGQVLNMVCLEKSCLQNLTCCCACIESQHKKHLTKPLRMVMGQAKAHSDNIKTAKFDIDVILDIVNASKKSTLQLFQKYKTEILHNLSQIEASLNGYYNSTIEQIIIKSSDPKVEIVKAFDIIYAPKDANQFKGAVKKVIALLPTEQNEGGQVSQASLIDSIKTSNDEVNNMIAKKIEEVNKKLQEYQVTLQATINSLNIWKYTTPFKFSSVLKHPDVKIMSDFIVKSSNNSGYKFAVMDPSLEKGGQTKTFTFKVKESSSNWVAVGMCHEKLVKSKNYGFVFGSIGHGGYMISANGGSWSNTKPEFNNSVKAFKFGKGDVITITANFTTKKMVFKKKMETYELGFETIPGDQLHPCVLFYYINDQVELLQNYKE